MSVAATTARANVNLALVKYWGKRDPTLKLEKAVLREQLGVRGESFENGHTLAEAVRLIPSRKACLADHAEN